LIWGGLTSFGNQKALTLNQRHDNSIHSFNLGTLDQVKTNSSSSELLAFLCHDIGPALWLMVPDLAIVSPMLRPWSLTLFVFGCYIGKNVFNDMRVFDLNSRMFTHRCPEPF
jgi:hypothetical protein